MTPTRHRKRSFLVSIRSDEEQGKLLTDSLYMVPKAGCYSYLAKGGAKYFLNGNRYFEIESGFCEHTFGEQMRGSFPADAKKFTMALTALTPQKSTVTIRLKKITQPVE